MRRLLILATAILLGACEAASPDRADIPASAPPSAAPAATATPVATTPAPTPTPLPAPLAERLIDPDPFVRRMAVQEMSARSDDPAAIPALTNALNDPDQSVALAAIEGLGSIGGAGSARALLGLVEAIPDPLDPAAVQRAATAVTALGQVRGQAAVVRLFEIAVNASTPAEIQWAANTALEALGTADVPLLAKAVRHRNAGVRVAVIQRLAIIGGPSAVDIVIGQVASPNGAVRGTAIRVLGEMGARKATGVLVDALNNRRTFDDAEAALARIHDADAGPLIRYLRSSKTVKAYAPIISIGQSGTERALVEALNRFGSKDMALDYLNCGNAQLDKAARRWAERNGYVVYTIPGAGGGSVVWGG